MNVHDSEKMAGILKAEGYAETTNTEDADLIIFNTCSIRQKAEQKFRSELGRIKLLKTKNPLLKIAVAGCIAQQKGRDILKKRPSCGLCAWPPEYPQIKRYVNNKYYGLH